MTDSGTDTESWSIWALAQPTPVLLVRDETVTEANRAAGTLFDTPVDDLGGLSIHDLIVERVDTDVVNPAAGRPVGVLSGGTWVDQVVLEMPVSEETVALSFLAPAAAVDLVDAEPAAAQLVIEIGEFVARRGSTVESIGQRVVTALGARLDVAARWTVLEPSGVLRLVEHTLLPDLPATPDEPADVRILDLERRAARGAVAVETESVALDLAGAGPALAVPVTRGGQLVGTICVVRPAGRPPLRLDEAETVHVAADHLGMVEGLLRAEEAASELASSEEDMRLFASALAHDLRAPLRHIAGFAEIARDDLARRDADPSEITANLDRIVAATERVTRQLNDMVEFIRGADVDLRPVEIRQFVEDAVERVQALAGADAEISVEPLGGTVHTDPAVAGVILDNLLDNAVKYADPARPLRIEIDAIATSTRWIIRVADNGLGIPEGREALVFSAFRRLHPDIDTPGSGMGLAISRRMAGLLHGDLNVRRREVGSRFQLNLPRAD
ncbi:MAG: HAMP domain-containing sensor histidine kinase [Actinomycetota bacterium]